jgi:hypothetical protein
MTIVTRLSRLGRRIAGWVSSPQPQSLDDRLVPCLFVRQLEDRRVLSVQALPIPGAATTLVVAGYGGNSGHPDTFEVSRHGNQVDITVNNAKTVSANLQSVGSILLQGSEGGDLFIIDFSGGDPFPQGGIQVVGGNRAGTDSTADTLQVRNDPTAKPIDMFVHQGQTSGGGSVQFSGLSTVVDTLTYSGIGRIQDAARSGNITVQDDITGDRLQLGSSYGGGGLTIASARTTEVDLLSLPRSLTIDTSAHGASSADVIQIGDVESYSSLDLSVYSDSGDTAHFSGSIDVDGGSVTVSSGFIWIDGSVTSHGGAVKFDAGNHGVLLDFGTIDVSNSLPGQQGGLVELLGDRVGMFDNARVDASGDAHGGTVLIGGDYSGANAGVRNASATYVGANVQVIADSLMEDNGGNVVIWSSESTHFLGYISARGGSLGGDGGIVETSGKDALFVSGSHVNASALHGNPGNWILESRNVVILAGALAGVSPVDDATIASATGAKLNSIDLKGALDSGTNVMIRSECSENGDGCVAIDAPLVWNSAANLTIAACGPMWVGAAITSQGSGDLELDSGTCLEISAAIDVKGRVALTAAGKITETGSGAINAALLATSSLGGTILTGSNMVTSFAATNSGGGDIRLVNTAATLAILNVSQSGGANVAVSNNGAIDVAGVVTAGAGQVILTATGKVIETRNGAIQAGHLATSSSGGIVLTGPNTVTSFTATNSGSRDIQLVNTAATLTLLNISQFGGGNIKVSNNGAINVAGVVTAGAGQVTLTATGKIIESRVGAINAGLLATSSSGGTNLTGPNTVTNFATTNSGGGDIQLVNTAATLTLLNVSQSGGGNIAVSNNGAIDVAGAVTAGAGQVTLTATGKIIETRNGAINAGLLTTNSAGGTILTGSNTVTSFTATNSGGGDILLVNTAVTLTLFNVSQSGGGNIEVSNKGAIDVAGVVTAGAGQVTLTATGRITEILSGAIIAGLLTTSSSGGTILTGSNTVTSFTATNSGGGDILLVNTAVTLTLFNVSQSGGGNIEVSNNGTIELAGAVMDDAGQVKLFSLGDIALSGKSTVKAASSTLSATGSITSGNAWADIDTSSANGAIVLKAASLGGYGNSLELNPGTGALTLTASSGDVFVDISSGDWSINRNTMLSASGKGVTISLSTSNGNLNLESSSGFNVNTQDDNFQFAASGAGKGILVGAPLVAASATFNASGSVVFGFSAGPGVMTTGDQTYNAAVELRSDTILVSTAAGNVAFNASVDGGRSLEVNSAGDEVFNGLVGGNIALTNLVTDAVNVGGRTQFNMAADANHPAGVNAGSLAIHDMVEFNVYNSSQDMPSVQTTGSQTYFGPVQLTSNTVLVTKATSTEGDLVFDGTIDSGRVPTGLTISATGSVYFGDNVGLASPLKSVTVWPDSKSTIAPGRSVNTIYGTVSNTPPVLFVHLTKPTERYIDGGHLTQTVYGYIGYDPTSTQSAGREQGQNYNIEILWADNTYTTLVANLSSTTPGHADVVHADSVLTMETNSTDLIHQNGATISQILNPNYNSPVPGDSLLPAPPANTNGILFAISHTYSLSFLSGYGQSSLSAVVKVTNNSSIQFSDPGKDGNLNPGASAIGNPFGPPAASSLNTTQTTTTIEIVAATRAVAYPPAFVPPQPIQTPPSVVLPTLTSASPPLAANTADEIRPANDTANVETRMIEIVKLDASGVPEKENLLTDVPEKLNELLDKLKRGSYRNGRYAVYLTEFSVGHNRLIEHRLLMEVYKSGNTLGDPVHEPGPGSNPLPDVKPDQILQGPNKTSLFRSDAEPVDLNHASAIGPYAILAAQIRSAAAFRVNARSHEAAPSASHPSSVDTQDSSPTSSTLRYPFIGAAVAGMVGLHMSPVLEAWSCRVDKALAEGRGKSLWRILRLSRNSHPRTNDAAYDSENRELSQSTWYS